MLSYLVHLASIANFAYAIYFRMYVLEIPKDSIIAQLAKFGGQWKYLTFINLWIQLFYFTISLANNICGSNAFTKENSSGLQKARDFFFATVAFPIGMFVRS